MINENVYGWRMTGLLGKNAKWFLGFSRTPQLAKIAYFHKSWKEVTLAVGNGGNDAHHKL